MCPFLELSKFIWLELFQYGIYLAILFSYMLWEVIKQYAIDRFIFRPLMS